MKEVGIFVIGLVLGVCWVVSSGGITVVHESGTQLHTNYENQTYVLVPCGEAECK